MMINWNDLTPLEQHVLEMLPVSVLPAEREAYDTYKDVVHRLVDMKLARPTLTKYKRIEAGDYVLAQKPQPPATAQTEAGAAGGGDLLTAYEKETYASMDLHLELCHDLGLEFDIHEPKVYEAAINALKAEVAKLTGELEAAKHYKTVYEYVINLDMQHEMLDMLEAHTGTDGEKDLASWGELYNAISELRDRERGYPL